MHNKNTCTDSALNTSETNNLLMYKGTKWINPTLSLDINNGVKVSSLTSKHIIQ